MQKTHARKRKRTKAKQSCKKRKYGGTKTDDTDSMRANMVLANQFIDGNRGRYFPLSDEVSPDHSPDLAKIMEIVDTVNEKCNDKMCWCWEFIQFVYSHMMYISKEMFENKYKECAREIYDLYISQNKNVIFIIPYTYADMHNKSNAFYTFYMIYTLRTLYTDAIVDSLLLWIRKDMDDVYPNKIEESVLIFCDDISYSGEQLSYKIERLLKANIQRSKVIVYVCLIGITSIAKEKFNEYICGSYTYTDIKISEPTEKYDNDSTIGDVIFRFFEQKEKENANNFNMKDFEIEHFGLKDELTWDEEKEIPSLLIKFIDWVVIDFRNNHIVKISDSVLEDLLNPLNKFDSNIVDTVFIEEKDHSYASGNQSMIYLFSKFPDDKSTLPRLCNLVMQKRVFAGNFFMRRQYFDDYSNLSELKEFVQSLIGLPRDLQLDIISESEWKDIIAPPLPLSIFPADLKDYLTVPTVSNMHNVKQNYSCVSSIKPFYKSHDYIKRIRKVFPDEAPNIDARDMHTSKKPRLR